MNNSFSFLERIAAFLLRQDSESLLQTLVVLPNRRSQVFLKQALAKQAEKDLWLPEMLTIDELMARLSGLTVVDPLVAWFELYRIHRELEKEKARPLDDFLSWAPLMLNDFSDVDFSMAGARKLFHELSEAKALEEWNLGERPLTEMQKEYLAFFRSLFDYYERLQMRLLHRGAAYKAMAYRVAAEKLLQGDVPGIGWDTFVFAGFNALTEAEKNVIAALKKNFSLHYLVHADRYYFHPQKEMGHEAGMFLRKAARLLKTPELHWVDNSLLTRKKNITAYGIPGLTGQAKFAGRLLYRWISEEEAEATAIAVVLADERLLLPLLGAVPRTDGKGRLLHYNVTMGYPLQEGPFYDLVYRWLQLLILRVEEKNKNRPDSVPLSALEGLMFNPLVGMLTGSRLRDFFPADNFYVSTAEVLAAAKHEKLKQWLELTLSGPEEPAGFLLRLREILLMLRSLPEMSGKENTFLRFQLMLMMQVLKLAGNILNEQGAYVGYQGIQKILLQLMGRKEINLKGEPLKGIQVMGMLETRNLDFDRVIFLGANEGNLPKTGFQESFIPYDLRRAFGLPLQNTGTAIASYHFFRLLQQAREVALIYNSEPDVLGGGEVSRFVLQIENELAARNPEINFRHKTVYVPLPGTATERRVSVAKQPGVVQRLKQLAERGISPSALNTYVRCPLQFYYRYVARIEVTAPPEVSVRSDTFGSVVHSVLEKLYQPFKEKRIDPAQLRASLKNELDALLHSGFKEKYGDHDMHSGRNILIYKVARRYVERFVENDVQALEKEPRMLLHTEKGFRARLAGGGFPVQIYGFIDRIDSTLPGHTLRIIDYKTGTVKPGELKLAGQWDALTENPRYAKAFQVLVYAWLFSKEYPEAEIEPGIISLKSAGGRFMALSFPPGWTMKDVFGNTEHLLQRLLGRVFDEHTAFGQTEDTEMCEYCDFKSLCNR